MNYNQLDVKFFFCIFYFPDRVVATVLDWKGAIIPDTKSGTTVSATLLPV